MKTGEAPLYRSLCQTEHEHPAHFERRRDGRATPPETHDACRSDRLGHTTERKNAGAATRDLFKVGI